MTIYSVFGASLAASALMGPLLLPVAQRDMQPERAPIVAAKLDESAATIFDRQGQKIGRSVEVVPAADGDLVAVMDQGKTAKPVAMVRGPDGVLRLVAE